MPQTVQSISGSNQALEDILYRQGLLSQEQLSAIKLESINSGQEAEKIILDHNLIPLDKIASARAQLLNVPFIKLEGRL